MDQVDKLAPSALLQVERIGRIASRLRGFYTQVEELLFLLDEHATGENKKFK